MAEPGDIFTADALRKRAAARFTCNCIDASPRPSPRGGLRLATARHPERELAMTGFRASPSARVAELVARGSWCKARFGTFVAARVEKLKQALSLLTSFTEDYGPARPHRRKPLIAGSHAPPPKRGWPRGWRRRPRGAAGTRAVPTASCWRSSAHRFPTISRPTRSGRRFFMPNWPAPGPVRGAAHSAANLNACGRRIVGRSAGRRRPKIERISYLPRQGRRIHLLALSRRCL